MNSSKNQPFEQILENSESTIKRDLRAQRRERTIRLEEAGPWDGDPFEGLRKAMEPVQFQCVEPGKKPSPDAWRDAGLRLIPESIEWDKPATPNDSELGALRSIERLERMRYTGHGAVLTVAPAEPFKDFTVSVGIRNDPKAPPAGAGGACTMLDRIIAALASMGYSETDVIVIGSGMQRRGSRSFDYTIFDECHAFPYAEAVDELSPHPGERHRQLSRKLTSSRSRAGKATRWSS